VSTQDGELRSRTEAFARDLDLVLRGVLRTAPLPFTIDDEVTDDGCFVVRQQPASGIALGVEGTTVLRLAARYSCAPDRTGAFLAVRRSSVAVRVEATAEPLFRYDYDAGSDGKVPAAHLNVHGHRDELVFAMMAAGHRLRGKARTSAVRRGRVPRVSTLHFPLGGHRFRPAFEDVLEMLVREFGLDTRDGWENAIRAGRERWRGAQVRAAVRDDPEGAAAALGDLGYRISDPATLPAAQSDRLQAL
jgi:hypothetical protein